MPETGRRPERHTTTLVLRETRVHPQLVPGRVAAARILWDRFGHPQEHDRESAGDLFEFQRAAATRARTIIARRGGVLIADSVGLGKTHVALELLRPAFRAGVSVTIVGPAALERHWRNAARDCGPFEWWSYAKLGRCRVAPAPCDFVVFDEAHALRNPAAHRYRVAHALARGARVVLLTATPVNNSLWDLYHLIRLFAGDRDFVDVGVVSLRAAFEEARTTCLLGLAPAIHPVLRAVLVRRTRSVLAAERSDVAGRFPKQEPPTPVYYAFSATGEPDLLSLVGGALLELEFPAHRPGPTTPVELLRGSLFKRLESSKVALARSMSRYDALLRKCADGLTRGFLVSARDRTTGDSDQLGFDELLYRPIDDAGAARELRRSIARERTIVARVQGALDAVADTKIGVLEQLLGGPLRGRRVIVFTQFRDTARHLHARLCRRFRVALIDGAGALLGDAPADRASVVRRFAPVANDAPPPPLHETIDVLIATDVLSEGFNLQDASAVVSYDLPWNPIRLVQRVGRIDRLGSRHGIVSSFHFVPGDLDRYLGLLDRIAAKTSAIEATVGSDMPSLHADLVRALDRRDPSCLARIEEDADPLAIDERMRALQRRLPAPKAGPDFVYAAVPAEQRSALRAMVAARVGSNVEWVAMEGGRALRDDVRCAGLIDAAATQAAGGPTLPTELLERILHIARGELARRQAAIDAASLLPAGGTGNRLGRRLLQLAAAVPGGADRTLCARIEDALERLAGASETALAVPLVRSEDAATELFRLLAAIESLPRSARAVRPAERRVELLAAIVSTPFER